MRKKIRAILSSVILIGLEVGAYLFHQRWAENLFEFLSIILLIVFVFAFGHFKGSPKKQSESLASYRNGNHLPERVDEVLYSAMIGLSASSGHFFIAGCWLIVGLLDFSLREEAFK